MVTKTTLTTKTKYKDLISSVATNDSNFELENGLVDVVNIYVTSLPFSPVQF